MRALGATDPFANVPAVCWDQLGFKSCSEKASVSANSTLTSIEQDLPFKRGSAEWIESYNKMWAEGLAACVKNLCAVSETKYGAPTDMKSVPWNTYSAITKDLQLTANQVLPSLGFKPLTADGKLGPTTCAGIKVMIDSGKAPGWVMPTACSGRTGSLTKASAAAAPSPTPAPLPSPAPDYEAYAAPKTNWLYISAAVVALGAVGYFAMRRRR